MTAKEYLMQIRKLDTLIQIKQEELVELRTKAEVGSIRYESDGSSPTRDTGKQERAYLNLIALKEEIQEENQLYYQKRKEILNTLEKLNDSHEISLLYKRYFEFKKWEEIANEFKYTVRQVHNIHGRALQHLKHFI